MTEKEYARVEFLHKCCKAARREGDLVALISNCGDLDNIKKAIADIKNTANEAKNAWLTWTNGNDEEFETVGIKHGETDGEYTRRITIIHIRENVKYFSAIVAGVYGAAMI